MNLMGYKQNAKRACADIRRRIDSICAGPRDLMLNDAQTKVLTDLKQNGAVVTTLEEISCPFDPACQKNIESMFDSIVFGAGGRKTFKGGPTQETLDECVDITGWGLGDVQLNIAEGYLGVLANYRGVYARFDVDDGDDTETRRWHIDSEDTRSVKFIIYLNDIGPEHGPYEFIPLRYTPRFQSMDYVEGRITDDRMEAAVPRDRWVSCTGPSGTVVITDTCRIWHRGKPPTGGTRRTLFFNYTTRHPLSPQYCGQVFDTDIFVKQTPNLTSRQRAAIGLRSD